jgi:hypothetical protein
MPLPIGLIVGALSGIAEKAATHYVALRKAQRGEKPDDLIREVADLQTAVEKQGVLLETLTEQARALALQVEQQEKTITLLRRWFYVLAALIIILFLLLGIFIWLAGRANIQG